MFSRNHRSRVTVARGSALEMEFKRGRFRLSLFSDPPEVRPTSLPSPSPAPAALAVSAPRPRPRARRGAETPRFGYKPVVVDFKSEARTVRKFIGPLRKFGHSLPSCDDLPLPGKTPGWLQRKGPQARFPKYAWTRPLPGIPRQRAVGRWAGARPLRLGRGARFFPGRQPRLTTGLSRLRQPSFSTGLLGHV